MDAASPSEFGNSLWMMDAMTEWMMHAMTEWMMDAMTGWMMDATTGWMMDAMTEWLQGLCLDAATPKGAGTLRPIAH